MLTLEQKFCLETPRTDGIVYGELRKIYSNLQDIRSYPSMSIPPGTDTEISSIGGYPQLLQPTGTWVLCVSHSRCKFCCSLYTTEHSFSFTAGVDLSMTSIQACNRLLKTCQDLVFIRHHNTRFCRSRFYVATHSRKGGAWNDDFLQGY